VNARFEEVKEQLVALRARKEAVAGDVHSLAEARNLSAEGAARFDRKIETFKRLEAEEEALDRELLSLTRDVPREPGDNRPVDGPRFKGRGPTLVHRAYYDPHDFTSSRMGNDPTEVRDRALTIMDESVSRGFEEMPITDNDRARIDRLVRRDTRGDLSEYVIAASRPAYETAFEKFLVGRSALWTDAERAAVAELEATRIRLESRAALSTANANGGYMIPFFLDPTVIIENAGAVNPFRNVCRQVAIPTNVWHGVSSTGVTASFSAEAAEMTDNSPVFEQPTITPIRATAYVQASWEVAGDASGGLAGEIARLFADAKNNLETTKFTSGSGSTEPVGIVTRLQSVTASRLASNTNGQLNATDIYSMVSNLPARAQNGAQWMMHWGIANVIRQFSGTALNSAMWVDHDWNIVSLAAGTPSTLVGAPVNLNSAMLSSLSTATASSDDCIILGRWDAFTIVDRIGLEVIDIPVVWGPTRRPTGERAWACWWRSGSDVTSGASGANADAFFRMLRV
jgi:HK97 family phage major capsid protein